MFLEINSQQICIDGEWPGAGAFEPAPVPAKSLAPTGSDSTTLVAHLLLVMIIKGEAARPR